MSDGLEVVTHLNNDAEGRAVTTARTLRALVEVRGTERLLTLPGDQVRFEAPMVVLIPTGGQRDPPRE